MKYIITTLLLLHVLTEASGQDFQFYFIDDVYQRSYINPALNNKKAVMLASGLSSNIGTDGPVFNDIMRKNDADNYILDTENGLDKMGPTNNLFAGGSVHLIDASVDLKVVRLSAGHTWRANGFLQYTRDLAEIAAFGNGPYIGETKEVGPAYSYFNYNEVYLGIQKNIGPLSIGARVKRLSGVQAIHTERSKINITTDDEFYALRVESDYQVNSAGTLDYFRLDSLDLTTKGFTFDNFMSGNTGWAFDLGASFALGDRLEVSAAVLDIGSITWDQDAKTLISQQDKTYDGIDLSSYIGTDDEIIVEDSVRALLDFTETSTTFKTTLPKQIHIGGRLKISELWTVGALLHMTTFQEKTRTAFALNATTSWNIFKLGVQYTARSESAFNIGVNGAVYIGPVSGFITVENVLAIPNPLSSQYAQFRAGLSVSL